MQEIIVMVLAALFGGGGIYALLKVRPEAGQISVSAAQGAVIVQTGVIDTLRSELMRATKDVSGMQERLARLEAEHDRCKEMLMRLQAQIESDK